MLIQIKKTHFCIGFTMVCIIFIIFGVAFRSIGLKVEQNEYAVIVNSYTMQFRPNVLSQGIYVLYPGDELIKFQRTMQNIELGELECLTGDEVLLQIHVAIQFQYIRDLLIPIVLKKFDTDKKFKTFLNAIMKSTILNSCLEFTALEYYEKRASVDATMFDNLMDAVSEKTMGATIEYFQLIDITYPETYIDILHQKQNTAQMLITAENNRNTEIINANTKQMEAKRTADINIINAMNIYNITVFSAEMQRKAILSQWQNRADGYKNIISNLALSTDQFIDYLKADVVRTSSHMVSTV